MPERGRFDAGSRIGSSDRAPDPAEGLADPVVNRGTRRADAVELPVRSNVDAGAPARPSVDGRVGDRSVPAPVRERDELASLDAQAAPGVRPSDVDSTLVMPSADGGTAEGPKWTFGVGVLGGVASGATNDVLPAGQLVVDVTRGWLGAAVDVGLSGEVVSIRDDGSARSSWQWVSASTRLAIPVRDRLLLEAQLGVRGYRVLANASGFAQVDPQQVLFSVGAAGSVGASFRLVGPVGISLRLTGNTRLAESFIIERPGGVRDTVLSTGPLEGSVLAGLVARF